MKRTINLTITTFLAMAAVALAADKDAIVAAEKAAWQSIKDKKFDQFQKMLGADFRGVYASGINKADTEATEVRTLDLKSYTLGEIDVVFINKDTVMTVYSVTIDGTEGSKDISGKMNAASVWKKDGNDWRVVFHTDIKAE
jgi:hypothetical protein